MRVGLETRLKIEIRRLSKYSRQVDMVAWARIVTMKWREMDSRSILEVEFIRLHGRWDTGNDRKGGIRDNSLILEDPLTELGKKGTHWGWRRELKSLI